MESHTKIKPFDIITNTTADRYHGDSFAIFPQYLSRITEAGEKEYLSDEIRKHYGQIRYRSFWSYQSDTCEEDSILVLRITGEEALRLGKKYGVSSIILKQGTQVFEICTTPTDAYEEGETIRTWEESESDSFTHEDVITCFKNRTLRPLVNESSLDEVYYVEEARPSMFAGPRPFLIFKKEQ